MRREHKNAPGSDDDNPQRSSKTKDAKPATPADDPDRMTKSGRLDVRAIREALKKADKAG